MRGGKDGLVVAIDGPAASGKSTVALMLARRLGFLLVDTGAMYRAVTLLALEQGADLREGAALGDIAERVSREFRYEMPSDGPPRVFLEEREITTEIRGAEVGDAVSPVSLVPAVRVVMVRLQRGTSRGQRVVVEGRDIGSVVFPEAEMKVFLDADPGERKRRRHLELEEKGATASKEQVAREIEKRDRIDSSREHSPLTRPDDAMYIDTTTLSVEQVTDLIAEEMERRGIPTQAPPLAQS